MILYLMKDSIQGWGKDKWEDGDYQVVLKGIREIIHDLFF